MNITIAHIFIFRSIFSIEPSYELAMQFIVFTHIRALFVPTQLHKSTPRRFPFLNIKHFLVSETYSSLLCLTKTYPLI